MTHLQTFPISGMTCGSCAAKVAARLREHADISEANVTVNPPEARIAAASALSAGEVDEWLRPMGKYRVQAAAAPTAPEAGGKAAQTYRPLAILLGYLLAVIAAVSVAQGGFHLETAMRLFMGGFFVAFSFFKMLDLHGFADAYRGYDLVAKAVPAYGLVYPFIELALGLGYLAAWNPIWVNGITAVVMAVSLAGVLKAVLSKRQIRCACLGTVFNLPMSTVTIVEDALMLSMAAASLFL